MIELSRVSRYVVPAKVFLDAVPGVTRVLNALFVITWIRREKRYPSGFQGSESVDLGQDLMSRLLDEL